MFQETMRTILIIMEVQITMFKTNKLSLTGNLFLYQ